MSFEQKNNAILVTYVPVIHEGYRRFFAHHPEIKELWLIGQELAHELRPLQKDIRALPAQEVKRLLEAWRVFPKIEILTPQNIPVLQEKNVPLLFSDETLSHHLTRKYFTENDVSFDSTFLRWDENSSLKKNDLEEYSNNSNTQSIQNIAVLSQNEATRSDDWWRQVGAVAFRDGKILLTEHNQHVPTEYETAYDGDPRADFHKGEYLKVSTAIHAEALLIAQAAQKGIALEGAELFVTTFPCPVCAKQVAYSGIKKLYFLEGYSVLDGESILQKNGVEIEKVSLSQS